MRHVSAHWIGAAYVVLCIAAIAVALPFALIVFILPMMMVAPPPGELRFAALCLIALLGITVAAAYRALTVFSRKLSATNVSLTVHK